MSHYDLGGGAISENEKKIVDILEKAGPHGVIQGDLSRILGLSKSWVSELLSSMERRGVVVRTRGPGKTLVVRLSKYADPDRGKTISIGLVPSVEYLPVSLMMKKLKEQGFRVEISLKRSVLEVAAGYIRGEFHVAFLPIYTLAVMRQLGIGFRIIGAVGLGGASLVGHRVFNRDFDKIFTSTLSTMEVLATAYSKVYGLHNVFMTYYRDPSEVVETISSDNRSAAVLWEPYTLIAEARNLKRIPLSNILGDYHCCLLIARDSVSYDLADRIMKAHIESIEMLRRNMERASQIFSKIIGLEPPIIARASAEYRYTHYIDRRLLRNIASYVRSPLTNIEVLEDLISRDNN